MHAPEDAPNHCDTAVQLIEGRHSVPSPGALPLEGASAGFRAEGT